MALSSNSYTFTSAAYPTKQFPLTFDPQLEKYLTVTVNGSPLANADWSLSGTVVTITAVLTNGDAIVISRSTDLADVDFLVEFTDGSNLRAADLDTAITQLLHICQELSEGAFDTSQFLSLDSGSMTYWDADNKHIRTGPSSPADFAGATDDYFTTKGYVDSILTSTGNLPVVAPADEGSGVYVGPAGTWGTRRRYQETWTGTLTGPGPTDVGVTDGLITRSLTTLGGNDYLSGTAPYWVGVTDDFTSGGSGSYAPLDLALEFQQTARFQDRSLAVTGINGVTLGGDNKTFTIIKVIQGWYFHLSLLVAPVLRDGASSWSAQKPPTIILAVRDALSGNIVNVADDSLMTPEITPLGDDGLMQFPRSGAIEVGQMIEAGGSYTRDLTNGSAGVGHAQLLTWTGPLPLRTNIQQIQFLVRCEDVAGGDWTTIIRPSNLTITTNPGFQPI